MVKDGKNKISEYAGGCLCGETSFVAKGEPINPHLCSCGMCQKSSGAPTVAWVSFPLKDFRWLKHEPNLYQSSEKTNRCSCKKCGGLLAAITEEDPNICITIAALNDPGSIVPGKQHSYKEGAPKWWKTTVVDKQQDEKCEETPSP